MSKASVFERSHKELLAAVLDQLVEEFCFVGPQQRAMSTPSLARRSGAPMGAL